jgi:acetoacetyl-CoA synthetase
MSEPLWTPSRERVASANLTRFTAWLAETRGQRFEGYADLWQWSVSDRAAFWSAVWSFCGVRARREPDAVLADGDRLPGARWFPGAELSFAENLLRPHDPERAAREALVFWSEAGRERSLTYAELGLRVAALAEALRAAGLRAGDRVAGFLPNLPEAVIAMLAATSLGAIWSSCSPDFGLPGVLDRFGQIEPRVLFAADGYRYAGKPIDVLDRVRGVAERIASLEHVVVVPHLTADPALDGIRAAVRFDDFAARGAGAALRFEAQPFAHPLYILYSSGTTGLPKCIVHGAGGTLLQHLKELVLHTDLRPSDRIFYFTTCGWMMWNWLVSSLAVGATVVLYDGSPFAPHPGVLFDLAERERLTHLGTSPRFLAAAEKEGLDPARTHDLSSLRAVLSTGSPLAPASFDWVYAHLKRDVCLSSISGGTDIVSCFALGNPTLPVWRGELQCRGLGMRVEVFDESGRPVVGEKGELVCTAPFPSLPLGFWNDPGGARYQRAYFARFPGVWHHGDFAERTPHDGMILHGRSDAVLNPGGVRIGTAEIYRVVETLPEVQESLVVGQDLDGDVRVVLFVKLRPGVAWSEALRDRIRAEIRARATPRHVPALVLPIADIPRTISGKIVELAVRNVIHGRPVENADALANPEALELFRDLPELGLRR